MARQVQKPLVVVTEGIAETQAALHDNGIAVGNLLHLLKTSADGFAEVYLSRSPMELLSLKAALKKNPSSILKKADGQLIDFKPVASIEGLDLVEGMPTPYQ